MQENDELYDLLTARLLAEGRHSVEEQAASLRLLHACASCYMVSLSPMESLLACPFSDAVHFDKGLIRNVRGRAENGEWRGVQLLTCVMLPCASGSAVFLLPL